MRKLRPAHTLILVAALLAAPRAASGGSYGTERPFVAGTGARAGALGLAGASLLGTPTSMVFNPGALARGERKMFEFYRTTLFDSDAQYHALSYAHPSLDWGAVGLTVLRLDVGGIEERDETNTLLSSDVGNSDTRFLLGYAFEFHPSLAAGAALKVDHQSFGGQRGSGVGMDVGLHGQRALSERGVFREIRAGLVIENLIEPAVKLDQEDVADPMRVAMGASLRCRYGDFGFVTAADLISPRYSPVSFRFGQEVDYNGILAARVGFDGSTPTFGAGGSYRNIGLDYAYRSEDLGSNHRFSLTVAFGGSVEERRAERRARLDAELQERVARRMDELEVAQIQSLLARADSLFAAGDYERARDQFEMALVWEPDNPRASARARRCRYYLHIRTGQELSAQDDHLTALYHFKQAAALSPGDAAAAELVTACERRIAEFSDRSRLIEQTLKNAIDLYAESRYVAALSGFEEVLRLKPDHRLAKEYAYKTRANIGNVVQHLRLQARSFADRGQYDSAAAALRQALAYLPDDEQLRAELAGVEQKRAHEQARGGAARTSPSAGERPPASRPPIDADALDEKFERGIRHFDAGEFEQAAGLLAAVWTVAPDYRNVTEPLTRAYLFMGMQVYSQERYAEAIRIWERILAIDPANVKAQRYLQKTREEASRLSGVSR
jgi:tetratricopeptide (TPR) repeat protein